MMSFVKIFLLHIIFGAVFVESINILAITPLASPSHHIFNDVLLFALVQNGYNVTILGHDADRHHHPNYTHIIMEGIYETVGNDYEKMALEEHSTLSNIVAAWGFCDKTCKQDLQTKGLQTLMNYPKDFQFDLIILDHVCGHCLFPLIDRFGNPPVIGISAFLMHPNVYGNVLQTHIPFFYTDYTDDMTLWQKAESSFLTMMFRLARDFIYMPSQTKAAESHFGKENVRHLIEYERNISLFLYNYNPALNYIRALPPNIVPIGGIHITSAELPEEYKKILDNAKHGVICFSLGTNIKSSVLKQKSRDALLKAFSRLKELVLWKFEDKDLKPEDIPKNVIITKWLPQRGIFGHPNTKLMITHGGLTTINEIAYFGLPVVVVPFFLDQIKNSRVVLKKGVGKRLDFKELDNTNLIYNTITEVLENDSYAKNAKKLSQLYRDQPLTPMETAFFWVKYILRHGGAQHFDLPTRDMGYMEFLNLDLFLLATFVGVSFILLVIIVIYLFNKYVCSCFTQKRKSKPKKKQH